MSSIAKLAPIALALISASVPLGKAYSAEALVTDEQSQASVGNQGDRDRREAMLKCRALPGYGELQKRFSIRYADQGRFNRLPVESLQVLIRTDKGIALNAARWFDPIKQGRPELDWTAFIQFFDRADAVLAHHDWLRDWRESSPGRLLELQGFGLHPEESDGELSEFVEPIWAEAQFAGLPQYVVLARLSDFSWLELVFNESDPRILVAYSVNLPNKGLHWLDSLPAQFHPNCKSGELSSKYGVINPAGRCPNCRASNLR